MFVKVQDILVNPDYFYHFYISEPVTKPVTEDPVCECTCNCDCDCTEEDTKYAVIGLRDSSDSIIIKAFDSKDEATAFMNELAAVIANTRF